MRFGAVFVLACVIASVWGQPDYVSIADTISTSRIRQTVETLSAMGSRVPGYAGNRAAAEQVARQFREIGLEHVQLEKFVATSPVDQGAMLTTPLLKEPLRVYPLWPNLVQTSHGRASGGLIDAGKASLEEFRGFRVQGSIALVDFNCGADWLNAARLGASAIVFVEPVSTVRGEAEAKFLTAPADIPRYWVSRTDGIRLRAALARAGRGEASIQCQMPWQRADAYNVVGILPGEKPSQETIVINAYYDSMSIVPSLAPGADSASGIAALLELARCYKKHRNDRTIVFVANGAHFIGLLGVREFIERRLHAWRPRSLIEKVTGSKRHPPEIYLFASLDLSSRSPCIAPFYKSWYYDLREDLLVRFAPIGRTLRDHAAKIATALNADPKRLFADGINAVEGKVWRNHIPGATAFDSEAATLAGAFGVTFATVDDARPLVDTPFDLPEETNPANVAIQTKTLACLFHHLLNDPRQSLDAANRLPVREPSNWARMHLQGGFGKLGGHVYRFDPNKSFVPNTPVKGSLAVHFSSGKTFMGVRGHLVQLTDDSHPEPTLQARFDFVGVAPVTAYASSGRTFIQAYHINSETGKIDYAPDQGLQGAQSYPLDFPMNVGQMDRQVVLFPCAATTLFDLIDPQSLRMLQTIQVYDGATDAAPREFGAVFIPVSLAFQAYVEDIAVAFATPGTRIKLKLGIGPGEDRLLLINPSPDSPERGKGYWVGSNLPQGVEASERDQAMIGGRMSMTAFRAAEDMLALNDFRLQRLKKHRISNPGEEALQAEGKTALEKANEALARLDYAAADSYARAAWGFAARAYPGIKGASSDVVNGVIFYLALLIPFSYFMERLLIHARNLKLQLIWASAIFVAVFIGLRYLHPAFEITSSPVIVFIAFVMGALSLIVSTLIISRFEEQARGGAMDAHRADVGRMSAAAAALNLGISNMRKRKLRTLLTSLSLVMVSFVSLSFTSIVSALRFNETPAPGTPAYNGILVRAPDLSPLQESAFRLLRDEFAGQAPVSGRAWFFGAQLGESSFITLRRGDRKYDARALIGLSHEEGGISKLDSALVAGRWFTPFDENAILLADRTARILGVRNEEAGQASVEFGGAQYRVVGILSSEAVKSITDLDNEILTPADFVQMQRLQRQGRTSGGSGFQEYVRMEPDTVAFVPFRTAINLGAGIYSVAIDFGSVERAQQALKSDLMPRLNLNLYAGLGEKTARYSTMQSAKGEGLEYVVLPAILAGMIVLSTMLGSVYERLREISIFSAVGLAPAHIAMLFLAEAMVYGLLGCVAGYFLGQLTTLGLHAVGWLPGLTLNFSSASAAMSVGIVMAVALISTLYPARKAGQAATPAMDRGWRLPEHQGDDWEIELPFTVSAGQVGAATRFIAEWLEAHGEHSLGEFMTQDVVSLVEADSGSVEATAWLAPFDLGVSQSVRLLLRPAAVHGAFSVHIHLHRLSGDVSNWVRLNRRFMDQFRKQFLVWRTLSEEKRERYLAVAH